VLLLLMSSILVNADGLTNGERHKGQKVFIAHRAEICVSDLRYLDPIQYTISNIFWGIILTSETQCKTKVYFLITQDKVTSLDVNTDHC
jgi:hypothetical protein